VAQTLDLNAGSIVAMDRGVRRQLFLLPDDNYFSLSTTTTFQLF
jgi:hypothetical protein